MNVDKNYNLSFSIEQLNLIIVSLFQSTNNKKFISHVRNLFDVFAEQSYKQEYDKELRVYIIKKVTKLILEKNLSNGNEILELIEFNGTYNENAIQLTNALANQTINEQQMFAVDKMISNKLKSIIIESKGEKFVQMYNKFKMDDFDDFDSMLNLLEDASDDVNRSFKNVRETMEENKNTLIPFSGNFLNELDDIIKYENNPTTKIKTGLKLFNQMMNGGFESSRVYCILGTAKGWKSGFMCSSMLWAKKYNKNIQTKDPAKKPVILYLTLENTKEETLRRIITYAEGNHVDFTKMTKEKLQNSLFQAGYISANENDLNEPSIIIMYKPNKSVTVADIGIILDDLNKQGLECVFLVVDYLKRIKPSSRNKDLRIELGEISDDLCVLAKEKKIPILTAMQLNRSAIKELNDTKHKNLGEALDSARTIGSSNISESVDIIQNVDCAFTVSLFDDIKTDDSTGMTSSEKYLIVRQVAVRFNQLCPTTMFAHRFEPNNGMRLIEDVLLPGNQCISVDATAFSKPEGAVVSKSNRW